MIPIAIFVLETVLLIGLVLCGTIIQLVMVTEMISLYILMITEIFF